MREKEGFVALLDVLGFVDLIARESYRQEIDEYVGCVSAFTTDSQLQFVLFSDSIVISTADNSQAGLLNIVKSCSRLFGKLLTRGIPLRGAIARGSFIREESDVGTFLAGRAVIEAYNFEKKQNWVGMMLTPSVLREFENVQKLCEVPNQTHKGVLATERGDWVRCVQRGQIPTHDGIYDGFAIVPGDSDGNEPKLVVEDLLRMSESLQRLRSLANDPAAQGKYSQSLTWLHNVIDRWTPLRS
jgi:hypothetical protein